MLDPDISTADARRLLSSCEGTPHRQDDLDRPGPLGWTRRRFLQTVGLGIVGGAAVGTLGEGLIPTEVRQAFAGTPIAPGENVLITIMMYGGNDGLNTLVPHGNGLYYAQRGS